MSGKHEWAFYASNFSHVLSVYAAHFGDMLFRSVGFPKKLTAVVETQFPFFNVAETGAQIPNANPNAAMVIGALEDGGLFSIQIEGGQQHPTGLQIDITGTEGVLRITNLRAFENKEDNRVEGMNGEESSLAHLPVPPEYHSLAVSHLDASAQDVAYLYAAYAHDRKNGTSQANNFEMRYGNINSSIGLCKRPKLFSNSDIRGCLSHKGVLCATRQQRYVMFMTPWAKSGISADMCAAFPRPSGASPLGSEHNDFFHKSRPR